MTSSLLLQWSKSIQTYTNLSAICFIRSSFACANWRSSLQRYNEHWEWDTGVKDLQELLYFMKYSLVVWNICIIHGLG